MLYRVKRRELAFSHLLAHALCNTPQLTLLVLLLLLNTWHQHNSSNSHQCPASPLPSTQPPMPSSKAAEPCFLLPHNHNRATSAPANTYQTQDFHSYTSSYCVQQGHHRQLLRAWKAHTGPESEVQFIGSTERGRLATAFSPGICWGFFGSRCWLFLGFVL